MVTQAPLDLKTLGTRLTQRLTALRQELQQNRAHGDEHLVDQHEVFDRKDQADAMTQTALDDAELTRDWVELAQVESALQRLQAGTFGACQTCGSPISVARLNAQPWALRCMPCQVQYEERTS